LTTGTGEGTPTPPERPSFSDILWHVPTSIHSHVLKVSPPFRADSLSLWIAFII
jgi:hypothetical protein